MVQIKRGAVYGVSGLPYLQETLVSSASLRRHMPELRQELHIDSETMGFFPSGSIESFFDFTEILSSLVHWRNPKFAAIKSERFRDVLYLDGDTYITDRLDELFDVLEQFQLAVMPAPQRLHPLALRDGLYDMNPPVPAAFPEYNAGVLLFRRESRVRQFLDDWEMRFEQGLREKAFRMDQASFRVTLYHSKLRYCALMPEYNLRAILPNVVKGRVKIIHAHGRLRHIATLANAKENHVRVLITPRNLLDGLAPRGVRHQGKTEEQVEEILALIETLRRQA